MTSRKALTIADMPKPVLVSMMSELLVAADIPESYLAAKLISYKESKLVVMGKKYEKLIEQYDHGKLNRKKKGETARKANELSSRIMTFYKSRQELLKQYFPAQAKKEADNDSNSAN